MNFFNFNFPLKQAKSENLNFSKFSNSITCLLIFNLLVNNKKNYQIMQLICFKFEISYYYNEYSLGFLLLLIFDYFVIILSI